MKDPINSLDGKVENTNSNIKSKKKKKAVF